MKSITIALALTPWLAACGSQPSRADLMEEVSRLEAEIADLETERDAQVALNDDLQAERDQLDAERVDLESERDALARQLEQFKMSQRYAPLVSGNRYGL